jgi:cytochrome c
LILLKAERARRPETSHACRRSTGPCDPSAAKEARVRSSKPRIAAAALALGVLGALITPGLSQQLDPRAQRGRTFVQTNCSQCHAIGRIGESPLKVAPPFRELHKRYPVESLAEALSEGIVTGHPSMPQFRLDVAQINDLLAYLKSLEPAQ